VRPAPGCGERLNGRSLRRAVAAVVVGGAVAAFTGCAPQQNALAPRSHQASDIASLFWWMMIIAWIGLALVVGLLIWSWRSRRRRGFGDDSEGLEPGERAAWYVVVGGGVVFPVLLIAALFVVANIFIIQTTQAPAAGATALTIRVIGHQWWWEVRYPGSRAVTANEIHIPVRTPVRVDVTTDDVIHSFWVPQLNRTIDTIPGQTNSIELYADAVGRYRGQCDEFCGLQHAHMAFYVFADPPSVFRRWLADQSRTASPPKTAAARAGEQEFVNGPCSSCHTLRGTTATGDTGPDLTHLATRTSLGAVTIDNTPDGLAQWIEHSQELKPGNQMPDIELPPAKLRDLVAYLEGLH
jgi:cytochrome c oxidase subunit II